MEPKVYPDSSPKAILERIALQYDDNSTREFLLTMSRRGIKTYVEKK
jgi:hypothetical protein